MTNVYIDQMKKSVTFLTIWKDLWIKCYMMSSCLWFTLQDMFFRKASEIESDTYYHYESYGHFTASIDRGGLNIPGDTVCEWCFMCYILFSFIGHQRFVDIYWHPFL